jgi:uncharacterized protein DUF6249
MRLTDEQRNAFMKNTWKKIVVVLTLLGASSLSSARGAVSVYAEETEPSSNAVVTTAGATVDTNASGTTSNRVRSDADHPPVRIDETGVHVGGANPVDINVPDFKHSHLSRFIDVTGIIAILSTFGMPVMIILVVFYFKHRRNKMAHETLRAMIEKGVPMTPELVAEVNGQGCGVPGEKRTRSRLLPALVLTGVGIALLMGGHDDRGGWILVFIGVAFLIVWFVEGRNQNNGQPPR